MEDLNEMQSALPLGEETNNELQNVVETEPVSDNTPTNQQINTSTNQHLNK